MLNNAANKMENINPIINKVASSDLITFDLEEYYPTDAIAVFDLKNFLFKELVLKEKDFREALKNLDWKKFENKAVAITCSSDAIVPMWSFMLVAVYLTGVASYFRFGTEEELVSDLFFQSLKKINAEDYRDKKVLVKGCSDKEVPASVYVEVSRIFLPVVKSLMYGEACSNVPLMKRK